MTHCNHLGSVLESQCPRIRSFYFYLKAKYGNLYLAPHFDVHIWLQANVKTTNFCKSWIFEIQIFIFDYRRISKSRIYKSWRKNICDIRDIRVFNLAKMVDCFENKFLFDPKGNFKNVEIEAKNGDLGLENGHGSKRPLFVTEDFPEEDGELQRTIIKKLLIQMYCHCLD